jgi:hypothetical protein
MTTLNIDSTQLAIERFGGLHRSVLTAMFASASVLPRLAAVARASEKDTLPSTTENKASQCAKLLDPPFGRGQWERHEDQAIVDFVRENGPHSWVFCAECIPGRSAKQCRERWCNFLDPEVSLAPWTADEDVALIALHKKHGNHWARISRMIPNRSANAIKNRWNGALFKRIADAIAAEQRLPSIWSIPIPNRPEFVGGPWEPPTALVAVDSVVPAEVQ